MENLIPTDAEFESAFNLLHPQAPLTRYHISLCDQGQCKRCDLGNSAFRYPEVGPIASGRVPFQADLIRLYDKRRWQIRPYGH